MTSSVGLAKSARGKIYRRKARTAYAFIIPALILFIIFTAIPFGMSFVYSFANYNGTVLKGWVGWSNFDAAFHDTAFMGTLKHVLIFAVCYVPLSIIFSLITAYLISQAKIAKTFWKILFYIPSLTSGVAMAFVWKSLLNSLNTINSSIKWTDGPMSMVAMIAISVWGSIGGNMLVYIAAMTGIPHDVYEAAQIDGANRWQQFIHITIPLLRPSTYFIFTTSLIGSFQLFDLAYLVFGQENHYTDTPVMDIYLYGKNFKYGIGSAMSVILFVIIMAVTVFLQFFVKEDQGDGKRVKRAKTNKKA
jgi:multiple sugar transport system permease protein